MAILQEIQHSPSPVLITILLLRSNTALPGLTKSWFHSTSMMTVSIKGIFLKKQKLCSHSLTKTHPWAQTNVSHAFPSSYNIQGLLCIYNPALLTSVSTVFFSSTFAGIMKRIFGLLRSPVDQWDNMTPALVFTTYVHPWTSDEENWDSHMKKTPKKQKHNQ